MRDAAMLRLALLEHLCRVADRVAESLVAREMADSWADRMIEAATQAPQELIGVVAELARSEPSLAVA